MEDETDEHLGFRTFVYVIYTTQKSCHIFVNIWI